MTTLRSRLGTAAVAIAVVATALVSLATVSGADTFGQTTIGASTARPGAGYKFGSLFTVASAGTTTSISFYARGGTSSQQFVPVVYRVDASNNPTTLVTSGATTTIAANQAAGWVTVPLPSVALTAGTYLLGWVSGNSDVAAFLYYDAVTNAGVWAGATFPTAPATWDVVNRENIRWSIYLTYTASGGGSVPVNSAVPAISGTAQSGSSLSATTGTWSGSPTAYAYQWLRCNAAGASCTNVGTNANTYALVAGDVGSTMRVQVTASNAAGPGTPAQSAQTAVVTAP
ncbi:MAG: hypothetical protein AB7O61_12430, partial [Acidimicrobiia bacterium]